MDYEACPDCGLPNWCRCRKEKLKSELLIIGGTLLASTPFSLQLYWHQSFQLALMFHLILWLMLLIATSWVIWLLNI